MIDITLQNLETELVGASMAQPVLLDIWAPWCAPCKVLGPVLEKLETAYAGRFKLAKLNSDDQPEISGQLSQAFGVRSIPFCVLFDQGQPVDGFVGALPEAKIREFLDKHLPTEDEMEAQADAQEAEALAADGDADAALAKLQQAVATNPANDTARADYIKLLVERGTATAGSARADLLTQARQAFEPVAGKTMLDARLAALGTWLDTCEAAPSFRAEDTLVAAIGANKRDFEARYELARKRFAAGRFTDAMDELLEIVMRDKNWNEQAARKTYVAILELMTKAVPKAAAAAAKGALEVTGKQAVASADPVVDGYRRKLSMALF